MQADGRGPRRHRHRRALLGAGRHRVRLVAGRVLLDDVRDGLGVALHADQLLHLVVVGRDLGVAERPVGHVGARHRPQRGKLGEIDVPEPRHLGVPVHGPAADDLRQFVDAAGVLDGRGLVRPPGARVHLRVGPGEVAYLGGQAVVGEHRADGPLAAEVGEVVGTLLEDHDLPSGLGEFHRGQRPAGAAADHHRPAHRHIAPRSFSTSATIPVSVTGSWPSERSTSSLV